MLQAAPTLPLPTHEHEKLKLPRLRAVVEIIFHSAILLEEVEGIQTLQLVVTNHGFHERHQDGQIMKFVHTW